MLIKTVFRPIDKNMFIKNVISPKEIRVLLKRHISLTKICPETVCLANMPKRRSTKVEIRPGSLGRARRGWGKTGKQAGKHPQLSTIHQRFEMF